ncbi:MAG: TonB-dependent receptor [Gammaproteobacteria bacterium]|nr:MAG: TonB-dependent receptor [Gammaproteobacteria bacterium]
MHTNSKTLRLDLRPVLIPGKPCCLSSALVLSALFVPQAHAQGGNGSALEEVTVTSRRYEENLQTVPVAVQVMDNDYLKSQHISTAKEIIDLSPGTNFTQFNKLQHAYSMRGLSSQTEGAAGDPSILTVIDDVVIVADYLKSVESFDVSRVEVLRGPQGTSFGRNATGGLVHIISNRPTSDFEGSLQLGAGNYGLWEVDGMLNGAFSDRAAGRLAVHYTTRDGYTKDVLRGVSLDGQESLSVRGSLLFNPTDSVDIYLKAEYSRDDDQTTVRQPRECDAAQDPYTDFIDPCSPWQTAVAPTSSSLADPPSQPLELEREVVNLTAQVTWNINDSLRLTSLTGYVDGDGHYMMSSAGTPTHFNFSYAQNRSTQFSEELRLDNHVGDQGLRWLAGIYFLNDDHDLTAGRWWFTEDFTVYPFGPPRPVTQVEAPQANQTESYGIYGELGFGFTEKLRGTAGLRYSYDKKDFVVSHTGYGSVGPVSNFLADVSENGGPCPPGPYCELAFYDARGSESWDHLSYRVSLDYAVSDQTMVYGAISEAYKTGGFNAEPQTAADAAVPYDPETALNFEIGLKSQWLNRVRLNASAFYVEYDDQQVTVFRSGTSGYITQVIDNAAKSDVLGLEVEYAWQLSEYFRLSGSYARLDAQFQDTTIQAGPAPEDILDISGNRPGNVPEWTATLVGEVEIPLAGGSRLALRADWRGRSSVYNDQFNTPADLRPGSDIIGASVAWTSAGGDLRIMLWGRNLTEDVDVLNIGPQPPFLRAGAPTSFGPPRTFGGTVSYAFR